MIGLDAWITGHQGEDQFVHWIDSFDPEAAKGLLDAIADNWRG